MQSSSKTKLIKGDMVEVLSGKDRGKRGQILKMLPKENKAIVSGINEVSKHTKPSRTSQGGIVKKSMPLALAKLAYFDEKSGKASRLGFKIMENGEKKRFVKKSGEIIG